ncbi:MAG: response regulator [Candidatus Omnitrophica bacterium]|nr:response regulator [Candidatus Omnitrophota bacterium]
MLEGKLVVLVDDDPNIIHIISGFLHMQGARVKSFQSEDGLFSFLSRNTPDLMILDVVLPGSTGFDICRKLRQKDKTAHIPVIMLSGKDSEASKVSGLDFGADDYVVKPFSLKELEARMKAVLRRSRSVESEKVLEAEEGSLVMDLKKYEVHVRGRKIDLTPAEFNILELLLSRKGQVFSRDRILDYLWGEEKVVIERTVDVHIRHLRKKLGPAGNLIKNVRGVGYKFEDAV